MDELSWSRLPCCLPLGNHEALICSLLWGVERAVGNLNTYVQGYYPVHLLGFLMPAHFYNPQRNKLNQSHHCSLVMAVPPAIAINCGNHYTSVQTLGYSLPTKGMPVVQVLLSQVQPQLLLF